MGTEDHGVAVDRKRIGREIPFITLRASRSTMRPDGSYRIGYLHCRRFVKGPRGYRAPRIVARASSCVMVWATENHRVAIDRKRDGEGEYRSSRCVHHEARCVRTALTALAACTAGVGGRPALDHVNPSVSINGQRRSETVKKRGKCLVVKNPLQTGPPERRPAH
jgi:hypothetical protein